MLKFHRALEDFIERKDIIGKAGVDYTEGGLGEALTRDSFASTASSLQQHASRFLAELVKERKLKPVDWWPEYATRERIQKRAA